MAGQAAPAAAASQFGLPGITRPLEAIENNDGVTTTNAQASQVVATGFVPFKQTDVVEGWEFYFTLTQTVAAGTTTLNASYAFPFNYVGPMTLNMQNQFDTLKFLSGLDAAIFQSYRPRRISDYHNVLGTQPRTLSYSAQSNLISSNAYTPTSGSITFKLEMPVSQRFDRFYPLAADGRILGPGMPAIVSPQYMAGTARIVQPSITYNPIVLPGAASGPADGTPIVATGTQTTPASASANSAKLNIKRLAYYQPTGPADSPPVFNWQYTRRAQQFAIGAVNSKDIPIPLNGQILSVWVRTFDPTTPANIGGPIPIANFTKMQLLYGSGLIRFDDRPVDMQYRFVTQHGFLPWDGLVIWDLAQEPDMTLSNRYGLNTMNTSGITIHLEWTGTQSASSYCVVGVEALTYVEAG